MIGIGHTELIVIGFVALLLFGHRLPGVMYGLGEGIRKFKDALHRDDSEEAVAAERRI